MSISDRTPSQQHLAGMAEHQRRGLGAVYTPPLLARFVLDEALSSGADLRRPILDPACGAGAFVIALIERIGEDFDTEGGVIRVDLRREFVHIVTQVVWGIDIDPAAVRLARSEAVAAVERLAPGPVPVDLLDSNIVEGDFLLDDLQQLRVPRPDLIVGNPPYVTTSRIDSAMKRIYRQHYRSAFGRVELYTLFMERAASVVTRGGSWSLITPDKYLTSESAGPIRHLLMSEGTIRSIARFESHRIFENAAIVPCVTVWKRGAADESHFVRSRVTLGTDSGRRPRVQTRASMPLTVLQQPSWSIMRRDEQALIEKISASHARLRERTSRISAGITTGFNPAFLLDDATASRVEPELVHPTIRGRDVRAHMLGDTGQSMLVPYVWDAHGRPELVDLERYPAALAWLEQHRGQLANRHCVRVWEKAWWDLHDPVGLPLHKTPKVLVPDLARTNRFAADERGYIPQHSVYYLIPDAVAPPVLAALLNSPAVELLVRSSAPVAKDGFSRYRKQFLLDLPVPDLSADMITRVLGLVERQDLVTLAALTTEAFDVDPADVERALAAFDQD